MDNKPFCQTDIVNCKQHPQRFINCVYYKKDCPYKSRLACVQCFLKHKTSEGFIDVLDVLNEPRVLLGKNDQSKGNCDLLKEYFDLLEKDAEQFISSFKEDILKQIEKLLNDLKEGIQKCNQFKAEITKIKENLQSNEAMECERVRKAFKDIMKVENYHESEEWNKFEGTVQEFVLQLEDQQIKQMNEAHEKLMQMETVFFEPQVFKNFKSSVSKSVEVLLQQLEGMEGMGVYSLCSRLYFNELLLRIQNKKDVQPKVTLLFKGTQHGLNGQAFWEKCSNKGPTLMICKSKSGYVFGGYTPLKWVPNDVWHKDQSKTSFVFSYTRKEIYPIITGDHAICCSSSYGPYFGNNYICIYLNFQDGGSNMSGSSYSNESYKIENPKTHLMGGEKPELVEMEVFLVE